MTKDKYLMSDNSVVHLSNADELQEYLKFRKEHDVWFQPFINEMAAVGIPNEPLFIPGYCKNPEVKKNGYIYKVESLDHESQEVLECINTTGIFLTLPENGRFRAYPIREFAYDSICKRAGDDCATMSRFDTKPNKKVLPVTEKAERLSRDFGLYSDICKVLYRDKKVSVALSKEYCILDNMDLIEVLEEQMKIDHPEYTFVSAEISHAYLRVVYAFNDRENEETFRLKLNDLGSHVQKLESGVEFCTSDIGLSRVRASIWFDIDDVRIYSGIGVGIRHDSGATIDDFRNACYSLGDALKESEEQIESLGNTDIRNVAMVVEKICRKYGYFPKETVAKAVEDCKVSYPNGGTGIDIFLTLYRIFQEYCNASEVSLNKMITLSESMAKIMKLPLDKIDSSDLYEPW